MSTTTLRIDDALKLKIAAAAKRAGKTAHSYMLEAISSTVEADALYQDFLRTAERRWKRYESTERSILWEEMKGYLEARARGEKPARPVARKPGR